MAQIIAGRNKQVLEDKGGEEQRLCSCTRGKTCPLDGKCLSKNLIYQATVTKPNNETKTYVGLASTEFKKRLAVHKNAFEDQTKLNIQTSLSKHVWKVKSEGVQPTVTWKIIDRGKPFSPVSGVCNLCTKEKFYIMYRTEMAELNSRSEIFNHCRHKKPALLIPPERKKSPGS